MICYDDRRLSEVLQPAGIASGLFVLQPLQGGSLGEKFYLNIDIKLICEIGADLAVLYSYLKFVSNKRPKDREGYFYLSSYMVCSTLGVNRMWLKRNRERLVEKKLIQSKCGVNQNAKTKYKV